MKYSDFIQNKSFTIQQSGIDPKDEYLNDNLFPFQRDIVKIALSKGRFCIWANTGLGKSIMQLSWCQALIVSKTITKALILAPLGVAKQTVQEGKKYGISVNYCSDNDDVIEGVNITNYERLDKFDCSQFQAIVLDESSCLKDFTSSTRTQIIDYFKHTQYKLACSATPSPNDLMELGNHCEFMGVMSRTEMLSMFFTHDGGETSKWRLKGHGKSKFWEFVSQWAICIRYPSDIGYSDDGYRLPPIEYHSHLVGTEIEPPDGQLIFLDMASLTGQRHIRKTSMQDRCILAADICNDSDEQWLVWCETNEESKLLASLIPDSVEVKGADTPKFKEESLLGFANGDIRVLVTKPSIAGMGMNFQKCHNVVYIGLSHSFEQYYQSVRRVWRFGQTDQVHIHIIQHHLEGAIADNLKRKEVEADKMYDGMSQFMHTYLEAQLKGIGRISVDYNPTKKMQIPVWLVSEEPEKIVPF